MGEYPNIILVISGWTFFFNKKIVCNLFVSVFIAKALNSIIKSTMFHFPCLKVSIFYSASAAFILSLNIVFISYMKSSQFWVLVSLSSSLSFCCTYIPATPPLRHARITMILLLVSMTLLLLRNYLISFHQSSNFVLSLLNHPGSGTMLLGVTACMFLFLGTSASNISLSVYSFFLSKTLFIIFNNPNLSNNTSILFVLYKLVLSLCSLYHNRLFKWSIACPRSGLPFITVSNTNQMVSMVWVDPSFAR